MSDQDIRRLFELAEREMRPELRARLTQLAAEAGAGPIVAAPPSDVGMSIEVVDVQARSDERRRRWNPATWLGVAAATALLVVVVAPRAGDEPDETGAPPPSSSPAGGDVVCPPGGETLGTVESPAGEVTVGLLADGSTFCLADARTGVVLRSIEVEAAQDPGAAAPGVPTLDSQAVVPGVAYLYEIVVPEGTPAASVRSASGSTLATFTSRVGRRLLVVDTTFADAARGSSRGGTISVYSSAGTVLATLTPDVERLGEAAGAA